MNREKLRAIVATFLERGRGGRFGNEVYTDGATLWVGRTVVAVWNHGRVVLLGTARNKDMAQARGVLVRELSIKGIELWSLSK